MPASSTVDTASRIAYGETAPSSSTGTATSTSTANSEPTKAPAEISSSASTARRAAGRRRTGRARAAPAAVRASRQSPRMFGWRSARRPPEPVADRERHQHHADRVRPDDRGRAEVRGEQADGRDLGARASPFRPRTRARAAAASEPQRSRSYGVLWQGLPPQTSITCPSIFRNSDFWVRAAAVERGSQCGSSPPRLGVFVIGGRRRAGVPDHDRRAVERVARIAGIA